MRVKRLAAAFALGSSIAIGVPVGAGADPDPRLLLRPPSQHSGAPSPPAEHHRSPQILLDMNNPLGVERSSTGALQVRKTYGVQYVHRFGQKGGSDTPVIFTIQGPALPRKRVGIEFELHF
jgi:hypothetical protein